MIKRGHQQGLGKHHTQY